MEAYCTSIVQRLVPDLRCAAFNPTSTQSTSGPAVATDVATSNTVFQEDHTVKIGSAQDSVTTGNT